MADSRLDKKLEVSDVPVPTEGSGFTQTPEAALLLQQVQASEMMSPVELPVASSPNVVQASEMTTLSQPVEPLVAPSPAVLSPESVTSSSPSKTPVPVFFSQNLQDSDSLLSPPTPDLRADMFSTPPLSGLRTLNRQLSSSTKSLPGSSTSSPSHTPTRKARRLVKSTTQTGGGTPPRGHVRLLSGGSSFTSSPKKGGSRPGSRRGSQTSLLDFKGEEVKFVEKEEAQKLGYEVINREISSVNPIQLYFYATEGREIYSLTPKSTTSTLSINNLADFSTKSYISVRLPLKSKDEWKKDGKEMRLDYEKYGNDYRGKIYTKKTAPDAKNNFNFENTVKEAYPYVVLLEKENTPRFYFGPAEKTRHFVVAAVSPYALAAGELWVKDGEFFLVGQSGGYPGPVNKEVLEKALGCSLDGRVASFKLFDSTSVIKTKEKFFEGYWSLKTTEERNNYIEAFQLLEDKEEVVPIKPSPRNSESTETDEIVETFDLQVETSKADVPTLDAKPEKTTESPKGSDSQLDSHLSDLSLFSSPKRLSVETNQDKPSVIVIHDQQDPEVSSQSSATP